MLKSLDKIQKEALAALKGIKDEDALSAWRSAHLGAKSPLMEAFAQMRELNKEERPQVGKRANEVKL